MTTSEPSPPVYREFARIEEYKAILEDTARVSDRRQRTNEVFLSLNTGLVAGIGLLRITTRFAFASWFATAVLLTLSLYSVPFNVIWRRTLLSYAVLLATRHEYIEELEREFQDERGGNPNIGMFLHLRRRLYSPFPRFGLSRLELFMTTYFLSLYPVATVVSASITYLVINHVIPPISGQP